MQTFDQGCGILAPMRRQEAAAGAQELDLVEQARQGDRRAFEALLESHLPQVWRVVWRILRHREDTEDVVQEVFLAAHGALAGFRGEARFSTWLHRIAVNRALNHRSLAAEKLRRSFRTLDGPDDGPAAGGAVDPSSLAGSSPSPLQELEMKELRRRLADCLERMPAGWRTVIALRDGESLSYEEISKLLGTALGTVRSRLARARLALRRCVEGEAT